MRFIDLFAGLGGFHLALDSLGHKCVFACELDSRLRDTYDRNFRLRPLGDIRKVDIQKIPKHDVLCAGFPCQPFSKAGDQAGFGCSRWGDLFEYVLTILRSHRAPYFILENVPNIVQHAKGLTWKAILDELKKLGYTVDHQRLSPHRFGIPQIRERIFIVGSKSSLSHFAWPIPKNGKVPDIYRILDVKPKKPKHISKSAEECLQTWQEFLDLYPRDIPLPTFPIWSMEFGADYPYKISTPFATGVYRLRNYRGCFGTKLSAIEPSGRFSQLPAYARKEEKKFPEWKIHFIERNRQLYSDNKKWLKDWLPKIRQFPPSWQKLEWNCGTAERQIWRYLIQFRASGVRVKLKTTAPSLVAMTTTQVPIVAWEKRYMTIRECARLQSMGALRKFPKTETCAYKALGNAVNVNVVKMVAGSLLSKR
jgi:DNA (cytosine-5)-methyltransferase 1